MTLRYKLRCKIMLVEWISVRKRDFTRTHNSNFITITLEISNFERIGSYFEKIGDGFKCGNGPSVYTYSGDCNGWSGISLEECKDKCTRNEIPNTKCPRQGVECLYLLHNNWGCHLADYTCNPVGGMEYTVLRKQGKRIHDLFVSVYIVVFV